VLVAPPGAGKTTLVPLALRDEPWAAGGKLLVLEPRRVAARAAARRMASLLGEAPGQTIGLVHPARPRPFRRHPRRGHHRGAAGAPPPIRPRPGWRGRRDLRRGA
jgi:hypothetical protein